MNKIKSNKKPGIQRNRILDELVIMMKYNKIKIDHAIYIEILSDGNLPYFTVSTDDVLNNTNNNTHFTELMNIFEEKNYIKFQEGSVLKYLNFRIYQYPIGFGIDHIDNIMKLVNRWSPTDFLEKLIHIFGKTPHKKSNSCLQLY